MLPRQTGPLCLINPAPHSRCIRLCVGLALSAVPMLQYKVPEVLGYLNISGHNMAAQRPLDIGSIILSSSPHCWPLPLGCDTATSGGS